MGLHKLLMSQLRDNILDVVLCHEPLSNLILLYYLHLDLVITAKLNFQFLLTLFHIHNRQNDAKMTRHSHD
jgi:hypothetical protein